MAVSNLFAAPFKMNLGDAALYAVLGLLIVFAVLAVLVGILTLFKLVFNIKIGKTTQSVQSETSASTDNDSEEVAAVISAVIACIDNEKTVKAPFVIKSISKLK